MGACRDQRNHTSLLCNLGWFACTSMNTHAVPRCLMLLQLTRATRITRILRVARMLRYVKFLGIGKVRHLVHVAPLRRALWKAAAATVSVTVPAVHLV